jgi:ATP-dependent Clp protease ATP-binding subunit ClpA
VPFAPISEENVLRIFEIHLRSLTELLDKQGITLELTPEARMHIAMQGFTPKYGVRPLKGVIRNLLRRPISRMIISGDAGKGSVIRLSLSDNQEVIWDTQKEKEEALAS